MTLLSVLKPWVSFNCIGYTTTLRLHEETVTEMLSFAGAEYDYTNLSEGEKISLLEKELKIQGHYVH